jgi:nitrogen fixation NifU-like protein
LVKRGSCSSATRPPSVNSVFYISLAEIHRLSKRWTTVLNEGIITPVCASAPLCGSARAEEDDMVAYSEKVMEHFMNPRNVGEIPDADGVGNVGNPVCGDMMTFYIKVADGRLSDVKFKTFGCGAAIAVSSMVSEMAKGKTLAEAKRITNRQVADELEGLPANKMHCSNLGADALRAAIEDYEERSTQGEEEAS